MLPTAHTSLGHLLTSNLWFLAPITFPPLLRSTNCAYVPWSSPHLQSLGPGSDYLSAPAPIYQLRMRPLVISSPPIFHSWPESYPLLEAHST